MSKRPQRVGLMGLGHIGRKIYGLAQASDDIEIVVVEELAAPEEAETT